MEMPHNKNTNLKDKLIDLVNTKPEVIYIVSLVIVLILMPIIIIVVIPRIKDSKRIRDFSSASEECNSIGITVTTVSSPILYIDTGISPSPVGMYAGYSVTNNTAQNFEDLWIQLDNFQGPAISLATNEDGITNLYSLPPGDTTHIFFYLISTGETEGLEGHDVSLYESAPADGTNALCTSPFSLTSQETIKANANKINSVTYDPPVPEIGGTFTMRITGETGVIGADRIFAFTPISYENWPANTFELTSSSITLSGGNTGIHSNTLSLNNLDSPNSEYTIDYTFNVHGPTLSPTPISPESYISSGQPTKHTNTKTPEYESLPPIQNPLEITITEESADGVEEEITEESPDGTEEEENTEETSEQDNLPTNSEDETPDTVAEDTTDSPSNGTDTQNEDTTISSTDTGESHISQISETPSSTTPSVTDEEEIQDITADTEITPSTTQPETIDETATLSGTSQTQNAIILVASLTAGTAFTFTALFLFLYKSARPMGVVIGGTDMTTKEKHVLAKKLCAKQYKTDDIFINNSINNSKDENS